MRAFDPTNYKPADAYPLHFHNYVKDKGGWGRYGDFDRWTPASVQARFRLFITTLRRVEGHPLHRVALTHQWKWIDHPAEGDVFQVVAASKILAKKN